jgi:hypothetical protein
MRSPYRLGLDLSPFVSKSLPFRLRLDDAFHEQVCDLALAALGPAIPLRMGVSPA